MAITSYVQERNIIFTSSILPAVGPDQVKKVADKLRGVMFPEEKYDDLAYMKKAKEVFEKLKNVNLRVKPF